MTIYGKAATESGEKPVQHLHPSKHYTVHVENLQYCFKLGCRVTKVHRVLEFRQRAWMRPYIDCCTHRRTLAKTEFEKDFWKLCGNACFGRTMEDKKSHENPRLIADGKEAMKAAGRPTLKEPKIYHGNLVGMQVGRSIATLDKPIRAGMAVLYLSKLHIFRWAYDVARKM